MEFEASVEVYDSHVYLNMSDMDSLGIEELKEKRKLQEVPFYLSDIKLKSKKIKLPVIGPCRFYSQLVLTKTDAESLGIDPPVRLPGRSWDTPLVKVFNGNKFIEIGAIVLNSYLTISTEDSIQLGIKKNTPLLASVNKGSRKGIIGNIRVEVGNFYNSILHIDRDVANAYGLKTGDKVNVATDEAGMFYEPDGFEEMNEYITNI